MIDSLFLETFSIPVLSTLSLLFIYYKKNFVSDKTIKYILSIVVTLIFLILFDRLNKLSSNLRTILLALNVALLYLVCIFYLNYKKPRFFKYVLIILITTLTAIIIENSITSDKNILLSLGIILLTYSIFKEVKVHFILLILVYVSFLAIDSPVNEINV